MITLFSFEIMFKLEFRFKCGIESFDTKSNGIGLKVSIYTCIDSVDRNTYYWHT